jgi:hypothetical protein
MLRLLLALILILTSFAAHAETVLIGDVLAEQLSQYLKPSRTITIQNATADHLLDTAISNIGPDSTVLIVIGANEVIMSDFGTRVGALLTRVARYRPRKILWIGPVCSTNPATNHRVTNVDLALALSTANWAYAHDDVDFSYISLMLKNSTVCEPLDLHETAEILRFAMRR